MNPPAGASRPPDETGRREAGPDEPDHIQDVVAGLPLGGLAAWVAILLATTLLSRLDLVGATSPTCRSPGST